MIYNNQLEALKYIFLNHEKLRKEIEIGELVNLESQIIRYNLLREKSRKWSVNERFLLHLALNLFDFCCIKVDMSRIDRLSENERDIALTAIRIRFDLI